MNFLTILILTLSFYSIDCSLCNWCQNTQDTILEIYDSQNELLFNIIKSMVYLFLPKQMVDYHVEKVGQMMIGSVL